MVDGLICARNISVLSLNWLCILQASVLPDCLDIQSLFLLRLPLPCSYTKVRCVFINTRRVAKGNWVSCHIYMVPSVLPYLFWVTGRPGWRGGTFLCLCYGVHSLKMWCLDISVILSHPADVATSEERALNDLCNLPVSGNISLSTTPEALFPPYRSVLFNRLNFLFCFNL